MARRKGEREVTEDVLKELKMEQESENGGPKEKIDGQKARKEQDKKRKTRKTRSESYPDVNLNLENKPEGKKDDAKQKRKGGSFQWSQKKKKLEISEEAPKIEEKPREIIEVDSRLVALKKRENELMSEIRKEPETKPYESVSDRKKTIIDELKTNRVEQQKLLEETRVKKEPKEKQAIQKEEKEIIPHEEIQEEKFPVQQPKVVESSWWGDRKKIKDEIKEEFKAGKKAASEKSEDATGFSDSCKKELARSDDAEIDYSGAKEVEEEAAPQRKFDAEYLKELEDRAEEKRRAEEKKQENKDFVKSYNDEYESRGQKGGIKFGGMKDHELTDDEVKSVKEWPGIENKNERISLAEEIVNNLENVENFQNKQIESLNKQSQTKDEIVALQDEKITNLNKEISAKDNLLKQQSAGIEGLIEKDKVEEIKIRDLEKKLAKMEEDLRIKDEELAAETEARKAAAIKERVKKFIKKNGNKIIFTGLLGAGFVLGGPAGAAGALGAAGVGRAVGRNMELAYANESKEDSVIGLKKAEQESGKKSLVRRLMEKIRGVGKPAEIKEKNTVEAFRQVAGYGTDTEAVKKVEPEQKIAGTIIAPEEQPQKEQPPEKPAPEVKNTKEEFQKDALEKVDSITQAFSEGKIGGKEVLELAKYLQNGTRKFGNKAISPVIDKIYSHDSEVLAKMVDAMGEYADEQAIEPEEVQELGYYFEFKETPETGVKPEEKAQEIKEAEKAGGKTLAAEISEEAKEPEKEEISQIEKWQGDVSAIFSENETSFIKSADNESAMIGAVKKLEIRLRPEVTANKIAEVYQRALGMVLEDFNRAAGKFKGERDMDEVASVLEIDNKNAKEFFTVLLEKIKGFKEKKEAGRKPSEPPPAVPEVTPVSVPAEVKQPAKEKVLEKEVKEAKVEEVKDKYSDFRDEVMEKLNPVGRPNIDKINKSIIEDKEKLPILIAVVGNEIGKISNIDSLSKILDNASDIFQDVRIGKDLAINHAVLHSPLFSGIRREVGNKVKNFRENKSLSDNEAKEIIKKMFWHIDESLSADQIIAGLIDDKWREEDEEEKKDNEDKSGSDDKLPNDPAASLKPEAGAPGKNEPEPAKSFLAMALSEVVKEREKAEKGREAVNKFRAFIESFKSAGKTGKEIFYGMKKAIEFLDSIDEVDKRRWVGSAIREKIDSDVNLKLALVDSMVDYLRENDMKSEEKSISEVLSEFFPGGESDSHLAVYLQRGKIENIKWLGWEDMRKDAVQKTKPKTKSNVNPGRTKDNTNDGRQVLKA